MAILKVRQLGDEILTKKCKPVREITPRVLELVQDMFDTMYEANGVGLAAPQVGVLRRIVVIDVTPDPEEGQDPSEIEELIWVNAAEMECMLDQHPEQFAAWAA